MPCSTGAVIWLSTSLGARPGAIVLICTWTGVVSGKASMFRPAREKRPSTTKPTPPATTRKRCCKDQSIRAVSIQGSSSGPGWNTDKTRKNQQGFQSDPPRLWHGQETVPQLGVDPFSVFYPCSFRGCCSVVAGDAVFLEFGF